MNRTDEYGERTEQPTALRLKEARREGRVARSRDLTAAVTTIAGAVLIAVLAGPMLTELTALMSKLLDGSGRSSIGLAGLKDVLIDAGPVLGLAGILVAGLVLAAAFANIVQVGWQVTTEPMRLDLARISPLGGFKRIFSLPSVVRAVLAVAKIVAISVVAYMVIVPAVREVTLSTISGQWGGAAIAAKSLAFWAGAAMAGLAGLDYLYQRWQHRQDLKMTRYEALQERKRSQGDPQLRSRRRMIQRKKSEHVLNVGPGGASVVIADDSGPAVGVRYASGMSIPKVVSRANGQRAQNMRDIAQRAGVPVVEHSLLANELYNSTSPGRSVPVKLNREVAEILAFAANIARPFSAETNLT